MKKYLKDMTAEEIIDYLKQGEIVHTEKDDNYFKMVDGFVCCFRDCELSIINSSVNVNYGFYFDFPDKLELEIGKLYKTKDGDKAFIFNKVGDMFKGVFADYETVFDYNRDGTSEWLSTKDIIGEWKDEF